MPETVVKSREANFNGGFISGSCYHWSHCKPLPEKDLDAFQYGIWRFETWQVTDGATGVCQLMKAPAGEDEPIVQSTFYTMESLILNLEFSYTFPDVFHTFPRSAP